MTRATKKSTPKPSTVRKSTRISKSAGTKKAKAVTKTPAKSSKKDKVVKKVNATSNKPEPKKTERSKTSKETSQAKTLEVCLLLDETASMMSWIERSKDTLKGIIQNV